MKEETANAIEGFANAVTACLFELGIRDKPELGKPLADGVNRLIKALANENLTP